MTVPNNFPQLRLSGPPLMRSKHVSTAQYLLKHNRFGDFMPHGKIDGVYGPITATAAYRAKYWLGYPKVDHQFGHVLYSFLIPLDSKYNARLPHSFWLRRKRREMVYKADRQQRALTVAESQVGYSPGYCSKYSAYFRRPCENWCADFISWCQAAVGSNFNFSYVPTVCTYAANDWGGLSFTYAPKPGDLVAYDWTHDGTADHIEYFHSWVNSSYFWAVGGNTGQVGNFIGGQVLKQQRWAGLMWREGVFFSVNS